MKITDQLATGLQASLSLLQMTLADFSDADLMVRPVPNANHTNWQLGHLVVSETDLLKMIGAKMPDLPPGFADKYTKAASAGDDAAKFLSKQQLLAQCDKTRAAAAAFTKELSDQQLAAPGPEPLRRMAPTVADLIAMLSVHTAMHLGQFQVIRRKLGKPILF